MKINLHFKARPQFLPYLQRKQRWACVVAHRRAGKTVACIMDLIAAAARHEGREPRFGYVAPTFAQAKDVAWSYLKEYTAEIPGVEKSESELAVTLPHNGARIRLYGAENSNRLRGIYLVDEDQSVARAYQAVCTPDFFGFNKHDELQYRGRLDDARMGDAKGRNPELLAAMSGVAETGEGPPEQFASMGCSIKWRRSD